MKIDLTEVKRLESRCNDLNNEFATQFSNIARLLDEICANVQSSELSEANKNLVASINALGEKIVKDLPRVVEFLGAQVTNYSNTNTEVQSQLNNLASVINETLGA